MHGDESEKGVPVLLTMSVLDAARLKQGKVHEVGRHAHEGAWVSPDSDKEGYIVSAFLGAFVNDDEVYPELVKAAELYPFPVDDLLGLIGHMLSWDYWEQQPDEAARILAHWEHYDNPPGAGFDLPIGPIPHDYAEAITHICARARMGSMWPRLVHGTILSYVNGKDDPEGPSFEPWVIPRLVDTPQGTLDGFHPIPRVRIKTPQGMTVLIDPDTTKRETLRQIAEPFKSFVRDNWGTLKARLEQELRYSRRRDPSLESVEDWPRWLFAAHILRGSYEEIASAVRHQAGYVKRVVKELRKALDLQQMRSVRCLNHKQLPPRFY